MYSILVNKLGLNPYQVLDEMEFYEVTPLIDYAYHKGKDNWEQARLIAYIIAQSNSTKKINYDDFLKFGWEMKKEDENEEIDWGEVEAIKDEIKNRENRLNNGK